MQANLSKTEMTKAESRNKSNVTQASRLTRPAGKMPAANRKSGGPENPKFQKGKIRNTARSFSVLKLSPGLAFSAAAFVSCFLIFSFPFPFSVFSGVSN
jgi:hypothetical protein